MLVVLWTALLWDPSCNRVCARPPPNPIAIACGPSWHQLRCFPPFVMRRQHRLPRASPCTIPPTHDYRPLPPRCNPTQRDGRPPTSPRAIPSGRDGRPTSLAQSDAARRGGRPLPPPRLIWTGREGRPYLPGAIRRRTTSILTPLPPARDPDGARSSPTTSPRHNPKQRGVVDSLSSSTHDRTIDAVTLCTSPSL
jgi:hypothetical protein